jgi:(E)-4-hydroxy-3-methylbut-2-enyl-diphosphate synthase
MDDLKSIGHFYLPEPDKWAMNDLGADYISTGDQNIPFMLPNGLRQIQSSSVWLTHQINTIYPQFTWDEWCGSTSKHPNINFIKINAANLIGDVNILDNLKIEKQVVIILHSSNEHKMPEIRRAFFDLIHHSIVSPVIIQLDYKDVSDEQLQIYSPTDAGALLVDGLGDGIMISTSGLKNSFALRNSTSFGTLQASRVRISKTEYISCPSCGRTLFDLQETTAKIRQVTDHLKGIKIGIMGCIVNGPGEMADADYGYVGTGKDKIALYKGQNVIKKSVPAHLAVDELIQLIKDHGDWKDAPEN